MNHPAAKQETLLPRMPLRMAGRGLACGGTNMNDAVPGHDPSTHARNGGVEP